MQMASFEDYIFRQMLDTYITAKVHFSTTYVNMEEQMWIVEYIAVTENIHLGVGGGC